jgi:D-xylose reductase
MLDNRLLFFDFVSQTPCFWGHLRRLSLDAAFQCQVPLEWSCVATIETSSLPNDGYNGRSNAHCAVHFLPSPFAMNLCPEVKVESSKPMPSIGLGFWKVDRPHAAELTVEAAKIGYRHFDCASDYGNEQEVGNGIAQVVKSGICPRSDLWITSKLWNTHHRPEHVRKAAEKSIRDLKVDYLDLYLIHFPIALQYVPIETRYPAGWFADPEAAFPRMIPDSVPISSTWHAMEELVDAGLVCAIGISNFGVSLIRDLLSQCRIRPQVLQVESHPYLVQPKLLRFCQQERIAMTAFSPLGAPSYVPLGMATELDSVLKTEVVKQIAENHSRTAAQVVLRWGIQRGTAIIPKSSRSERLRENFALQDFSLTPDEMKAIESLDRNQRFNDPGVFCEQAFGCYFPIYE